MSGFPLITTKIISDFSLKNFLKPF